LVTVAATIDADAAGLLCEMDALAERLGFAAQLGGDFHDVIAAAARFR
jgi:hypothetical protein